MENGDFINFGTYALLEVDMLKAELEKNGIPVKVLYLGTNMGRDSSANAATVFGPEANTGNTLFIPAGYRKTATEIRDNLYIKPM
jgi:hypothetical protein